MKLAGATILITGGRRVGRELALRLGECGARIALTYHTSKEIAEQAVEEIETAGSEAIALAADLTDAEQAERSVRAVVEKWGRLDVLVNMASVYKRTPFRELQPSDFDRMIAANLAAPYHTAIAAGKAMLEQNAIDGVQGKIINIGDWATDRPYRDYLPYLAAKGGLTTFTQALAVELAPGIAVNMVQPAMVAAPEGFSEADEQRVIEQIPLRRSGTPSDVNNLIVYLILGTNFVTGSLFRVDGGRFLGDSIGE